MKELIERLEGLTGPCREMDAAIFRALAGNPTDHCYELNGKYLVDANVPPVTKSIDAAMTLAEGVRCRLIIAEDGISDVLVDGTQGCGHNTAIAICIAYLKGRYDPTRYDAGRR